MRRPIIRVRFHPQVCNTAQVITLAVLLACVHVSARAQAPLLIKASFAGKPTVTPLERIVLSFNRPLATTEGKVAIFVGVTDMTALFTGTAQGFVSVPRAFPWPAGEHPLTLYLVSSRTGWRQLAHFTLRVAAPTSAASAPATPTQPTAPKPKLSPASTNASTNSSTQASTDSAATPAATTAAAQKRFGFDKLEVKPALTLTTEAQPASSNTPLTLRPARPTYTDVLLQGGLQTDVLRGGFHVQTQFDLVGSSFQGGALRFGQLGRSAPQLDLSSYLMQFETSRAKLQVGHLSYGTNRYLIDSFSSRGLSFTMPFAKGADFSVASMNGTSIVGWDNFFGLDQRQHQLVSGTLGYDFLPARPGGLRLEASVLGGSLLPQTNVNQGAINDAEKSRGAGLRLIAASATERWRLDVGFVRSRHTNPADQLLEQGNKVVTVIPLTRNARYLDSSYYLWRDVPLNATTKASLQVTYHHERLDPFFRSLGASPLANKQLNHAGLVAQVGEVQVTYAQMRFHDNLENLASMLKSLTRHDALQAGLPLTALMTALFGQPPAGAQWLPRLSYAYERTQQRAAFLPINAGFSAAQLPNQAATNQTLSAEWQTGAWRYGYRANFSAQRNFGVGRSGAQLFNLVHGLTLGFAPLTRLELNFDLSNEALTSKDDDEEKDRRRLDRNWRFGSSLNWRMTARSTVMLSYANTLANSFGDRSLGSNSRNANLNVQWQWQFLGNAEADAEKRPWQKVTAQAFVRYGRQTGRSFNELFNLATQQRGQTLNAGLIFTLF